MRTKAFSFALISLFFIQGAICQNVEGTRANARDNNPGRKYMRPSVNILVLDRGTQRSARMQKLIISSPVPGKFSDHNTATRTIRVGADATMVRSIFEPELKTSISRQIVAKWFNRNEKGEFNMDLIGERGMYSASDADVIKAKASQRKLDLLRDAGESLIDRTYIMVYDVKAILTADEYAAKTGGTRDKEGYVAFYDCYLYKLDWNDSIAAIFYNNLWIDASQPAPDRVALFEKTNFPIKYLTVVSNAFGPINSTQYKDHSRNLFGSLSDEELFNNLFEEIVNETNVSLAQVNEDFKVKAPVFSTGPITAKIGLKEGLTVDKRFFAYEFELDKNGKRIAKRKAVVRASSQIADNRKIATGEGETSRFYQVAGGRVYEGMLLQENPDWGLGITLGTVGNPNQYVTGLSALTELSLSQWGGKAFKSGGMPSGLKIYAHGVLSFENLEFTYNNTDYSYWRRSVSAGLSKDLHFLHMFVLTPFAGYGVENFINSSTDTEFENDNYLASFLQGGVRLGMNIVHNVQIIGSIYYNAVVTVEAGSKNDITDKENNIDYIQKNSSNDALVNFGIRFQF